LVTDIVAALEDIVQNLVEERLQLELGKKLIEFESKIIEKVLKTIDSAVDFSLARAIEARTIEMAWNNDEGEDLHFDDLAESNFHDATTKLDADLDELDKTQLVGGPDVAADEDVGTPAEGTVPMATDSAQAKRTRSDGIESIARQAAEALGTSTTGPLSEALLDRTNRDVDEENLPPARKFKSPGTVVSKQNDIRQSWTAGRQ
jgi:hypothetical protein